MNSSSNFTTCVALCMQKKGVQLKFLLIIYYMSWQITLKERGTTDCSVAHIMTTTYNPYIIQSRLHKPILLIPCSDGVCVWDCIVCCCPLLPELVAFMYECLHKCHLFPCCNISYPSPIINKYLQIHSQICITIKPSFFIVFINLQ